MHLIQSVKAHADGIWGVCYAEKMIYTCSVDSTIKVFNEQLEPITTFKEHSLGVTSIAVKNGLLASVGLDSMLHLFDLNSNSLVKSLDIDCFKVCFMNENSIATCHSNSVQITSTKDYTKLCEFQSADSYLMSIASSPTRIACGSESGSIYVYDQTTSKLVYTFHSHTQPVRSLTFSDDGSLLISASDDKRILLHDVQHGNLAGQLLGHSSWVVGVSAADWKTGVSCGADGKCKVWDLGNKQTLHTFDNHVGMVWAVDSNGENRMVSVGDDGNLNLYSIST